MEKVKQLESAPLLASSPSRPHACWDILLQSEVEFFFFFNFFLSQLVRRMSRSISKFKQWAHVEKSVLTSLEVEEHAALR